MAVNAMLRNISQQARHEDCTRYPFDFESAPGDKDKNLDSSLSSFCWVSALKTGPASIVPQHFVVMRNYKLLSLYV